MMSLSVTVPLPLVRTTYTWPLTPCILLESFYFRRFPLTDGTVVQALCPLVESVTAVKIGPVTVGQAAYVFFGKTVPAAVIK